MRLKADGITCYSCAEDMENILREKEGILDATVNYAEEIVHIKYDPKVIDRKDVLLSARKLGNISKIISEQ